MGRGQSRGLRRAAQAAAFAARPVGGEAWRRAARARARSAHGRSSAWSFLSLASGGFLFPAGWGFWIVAAFAVRRLLVSALVARARLDQCACAPISTFYYFSRFFPGFSFQCTYCKIFIVTFVLYDQIHNLVLSLPLTVLYGEQFPTSLR